MCKENSLAMQMSLGRLYELSGDDKSDSPITPELHKPNDFYGHATILKKYANYPPKYQIKAAIEHAPSNGIMGWDLDINSELPAIFVWTTTRYPVLAKQTQKALFSIGPLLKYAPDFLDHDQTEAEKKRLGKNLLVFPSHSTHHINTDFDIHAYCEHIEKLGKEFHTIRICFYWKDILRGKAQEFMKHGFECVTAGHMFDPLFLPRLKSIIGVSTITSSNSAQTHVGYCILMEKPHYIFRFNAKSAGIGKIGKANLSRGVKGDKSAKEISAAFSEFRDDITPGQIDVVDRYWGASEFKTKEEIRLLFSITEDMYTRSREYFLGDRHPMISQIIDYLNQNRNEKALFLTEQARKRYPDINELNFGRALVLVRLGKIVQAKETLEKLLSLVPEHRKANQLLRDIEPTFRSIRHDL